MKKILFLSLSAVLVLALVVAAGCVDSQSEPVTGDWYCLDGTYAAEMTLNDDGTGSRAEYTVTEQRDGTSSYTFIQSFEFYWAANGGGSYSLTYNGGLSELASYDSQAETFTYQNHLYERASAMQGDKIIGNWCFSTDDKIQVISFGKYGNGKYSKFDKASASGDSKYGLSMADNFTWTALTNNIYEMDYEDGMVLHAVYEPVRGQLNINEDQFVKKEGVHTQNDVLVGSWYKKSDTYVAAMTNDENGFGFNSDYLISKADDGTISYLLKASWPYTWGSLENGLYVFTYPDHDIDHGLIDPQSGTLIAIDFEYIKSNDMKTVNHPVIGSWYSKSDICVDRMVFDNKGTGKYNCYLAVPNDDGTETYVFNEEYDFVWASFDDNLIMVKFSDGEINHMVYDKQTGMLTNYDNLFNTEANTSAEIRDVFKNR